MPHCCRIKSYELEDSGPNWVVEIKVPLPPDSVDYRPMFQDTFPGTSCEAVTTQFEDFEIIWSVKLRIPKTSVSREELDRLLEILRWTVTISDRADESHAVYLHMIPFPPDDDDPDAPDEWRNTRLGKLVKKAKSYDRGSGSTVAADELFKTAIEHWIGCHPRYSSADIIISAPPGNTEKKYDLPEYLAKKIAQKFGMEFVSCRKTHHMEPQKSIERDLTALHENVAGKFKVDEDLIGKTAVIFDDIYGSGATMADMVRACRVAGAGVVLSLTATKNAKFCQGLPPSYWYQVSMSANAILQEKDDA